MVLTGAPADGWRAMSEADLDAVCAISDRIHGNYSEDREIYRERLKLFPQGCFVLETNCKSVGYLIGHPWNRRAPPALHRPIARIAERDLSYHIHDLALLPRAQGYGWGAAAAALSEQVARTMGIDSLMLVAIHDARGFWERLGFTEAGAAPSYGEEARLMRKHLPRTTLAREGKGSFT